MYRKRKEITCAKVTGVNFLITGLGERCEHSRAGRTDVKLCHLWRTSLPDRADKQGWKGRLGACRRICSSLLIWTSILMGHLTLIFEARPGDTQGSSEHSHSTPRARKWLPLWASKMHYLCSSVCSAFLPVPQLIVSIVTFLTAVCRLRRNRTVKNWATFWSKFNKKVT